MLPTLSSLVQSPAQVVHFHLPFCARSLHAFVLLHLACKFLSEFQATALKRRSQVRDKLRRAYEEILADSVREFDLVVRRGRFRG